MLVIAGRQSRRPVGNVLLIGVAVSLLRHLQDHVMYVVLEGELVQQIVYLLIGRHNR